MRILFVNRPTLHSLPGGDVVQMNETKAELERLGLQVDISHELHPRLDGYDLIHLFNLETPETTLIQAEHVHRSGRPMVLSTIYWDLGDDVRFRSFFKYGRWPGLKRLLGKTISRKVFWSMYGPARRRQQSILNLVDGLLPNSQLEADHLAKNFTIPPHVAQRVVVNGVRSDDWPVGDPERFKQKFGVADFVLEVGRIGFIKNQLSLIKALADTPYPLVLAGQITDPYYYHLCQTASKSRPVFFLPMLDRQDLADAYSAARVHALPSHKETVGLVSLEAGLYGCRLVSTTNGGGREYLQGDAEYCHPNSLTEIRQAVDRAWVRPRSATLRQRIITDYTWDHAARQTLAAYQAVMTARSVR